MPFAQSGGNNVGSSQIIDNQIVNADINSAAGIQISKLNFGTGVQSSQMHESLVKTAEISITAAEIKALHATPKTLIAAPGVDKLILVDEVIFNFTVGTQYANGNDLHFYYAGTSVDVIDYGQTNSYLIGASSVVAKLQTIIASDEDNNYNFTGQSNKAITLSTDTAYITGTGTLKLHIKYRVITL